MGQSEHASNISQALRTQADLATRLAELVEREGDDLPSYPLSCLHVDASKGAAKLQKHLDNLEPPGGGEDSEARKK